MFKLKSKAKLSLHNLKTVKQPDGNIVAVSRSGVLIVHDEHGRERERYKVPYGAVLNVKDGGAVKAGQVVAQWDPHTHPIITEVAGRIKFVDLIEGVTMNRQTDELTGLSSIVVTEPNNVVSAVKNYGR